MLFATATLLVSFFALVDAAPQPVARASGQYIHPGRDTSKCLAVVSAGGRNPNIVNNAPVVAVDCSSTSLGVSKLWTISRGNNLVQLGDTGYCLDAGSNPSNNVQAKIYQCYPGLSQQQWYYTDDNRIAITGGTQCLDYRSDGVVQTYTCSTGNTNQVWLTNNGNGGGSPPVSSSVVPPPPSSSVAPPGPSQSTVPPPTGGKRIQAASDKSICLTVESKNVGDGTRVGFTPCSSALDSQQLWTYTAGSRGLIKLASANYCLDAGSNPANNIGAKVWTCYDGLSNQEWTIATGTISIQSANQCLDRQQGSTDVVQTYQCFNGNSNQMWIYQ